MEHWLQQIIGMLPGGAIYLSLLFFIAFSESLPIIGLLMPGSTLVVLGGVLVVQGKGDLLSLMLVTASGAFLGDLLSFWLGGHLGSRLLSLRSFRRHADLVRKSERFFYNHGGKSIFFARFLGPIRGITPFIAGLSRMSRRDFLGYAIFSAILWGLCYPGLGYLGGASWQQAQSLTARFGLLVFFALLITLLHYGLKKIFGQPGGKHGA